MMNPLIPMKKTAQSLAIATTLITGLLLTPTLVLADGGKSHSKGGDYSSHKHQNNRQYTKTYHNDIKQDSHKRKQHDKYGNHGHAHKKHHKHYDRGYPHKYIHADNHVHVINQYRSYEHGHSHYYDYDPRISIGLHLGHFDLFFQE